MGRSSKRRKERAHDHAMRERSLAFWALIVKKKLKAELGNKALVQIEACDPKLQKLIVKQQQHDGRLQMIDMKDAQPIRIFGLTTEMQETLLSIRKE